MVSFFGMRVRSPRHLEEAPPQVFRRHVDGSSLAPDGPSDSEGLALARFDGPSVVSSCRRLVLEVSSGSWAGMALVDEEQGLGLDLVFPPLESPSTPMTVSITALDLYLNSALTCHQPRFI